MTKRFFLLFFILANFCLTVYSQDEADADAIFVIDSFLFNIEGITKQSALIKNLRLKQGQEITGLSALEDYIQEKTQLLNNQRVLESSSIEHSIGQINKEGKYPVGIIINVKDTNNFGVFPNPQYSSSYGFGLSVVLIHNNFFGTMSPFQAEIGYKHDELGRDNYLLSLKTITPFNVFGIDWDFAFRNDFLFRPDVDNPLLYANVTGLSTDIYLNSWLFTPGFFVSVILNQEVTAYGNTTSDNHTILFGPELKFSRIDWIGNFRKGYSIEIIQNYNYYFYNNRFDINPWGISTGIIGTAHLYFSDFFGISSRLMFRHWAISSTGYYSGDALRGIIDNDVRSNLMLSLNLDFNFKVFMFRPSEWFNNKKLEILNFDLHLSPVIDTALYQNETENTSKPADNFLVTGGIEALVYPQKFRSFCLRVSFGKMLYGNIETGSYELFIGGKFFY